MVYELLKQALSRLEPTRGENGRQTASTWRRDSREPTIIEAVAGEAGGVKRDTPDLSQPDRDREEKRFIREHRSHCDRAEIESVVVAGSRRIVRVAIASGDDLKLASGLVYHQAGNRVFLRCV